MVANAQQTRQRRPLPQSRRCGILDGPFYGVALAQIDELHGGSGRGAARGAVAPAGRRIRRGAP
eukprot:3329647-Lingulodinium_polyedra.AAC.1